MTSPPPPPPTPPPRYATPRDPSRATFGPAVAKVSAALGQPLMPWQRHVADVALEVDERGRFVHSLVVISVPRQSGKTTLVLANAVHRCLFRSNQRAWHTAQTGQDARDQWREMAGRLLRSPLEPLVTVKWGAGDSRAIFATGSELRPHPPTVDALHGKQSDLNNVDEGWVFDDAQGAALMQAIVPTQATRPGAQTIVLSTMGTANSTWFHGLSDRGRDGDPGMAYFEWSIPEDADPLDLDVVAGCHPAYGHTIDMDALRRARDQLGDKPGEFARAYGNRRTGAGERLFPRWEEAQTSEPFPADVRPAFGAAVAIDRSETAIVAAAHVDGLPVVELIECRPGTAWAAPRLRQLAATHRHHGLAVDRAGPSVTLADELGRLGVELMPIGTRDITAAAGNLLDRLNPRDGGPIRLRFRTDPAFSAAAEIAALRPVGDAFALSRRAPGSIASLEAAALAVYALEHQPPPAAVPVSVFG
ncbi:terminase large subunit domain-containing protein [Nocardia altamirensis]|uniref:terminase large subunit domain-containing protein n=1 Tax=Nocardia altamirensis TaxID=472158 RepID=UPI001C3FEF16|nr:terminase family protein [Nocardia altamirensis]